MIYGGMVMKKKRMCSLLLILALIFGCIASAPVLSSRAATSNKIALSDKKLSLVVGGNYTLTLLQGGKKLGGVKWATSNKKVATVSGGKVTGKKKGSAKITATYKKKKYTCTVSVAVATLAISNTKATITVGKNQTVYVTKNGKKVSSGVVWKSNKESVATVNKGKIVAKAKGKAVISAAYMGKTFKCTVTVKTATIALSKSSLSLTVGDSETISLTSDGTKISSGVTWSVPNPWVAEVSNGTITAKNVGDVVVSAKYNGVTYPCSVSVKSPVLTFSNSEVSLVIGDSETVELYKNDKKVSGADATWKVVNPVIASVENGFVKGLSEGSTDVNVTYLGKTEKFMVEVIDPEKVPVWNETTLSLRPFEYHKFSLKLKNGTDVTSTAQWTLKDDKNIFTKADI